jgi:hypothetical protein
VKKEDLEFELGVRGVSVRDGQGNVAMRTRSKEGRRQRWSLAKRIASASVVKLEQVRVSKRKWVR